MRFIVMLSGETWEPVVNGDEITFYRFDNLEDFEAFLEDGSLGAAQGVSAVVNINDFGALSLRKGKEL